LFRSISTYRVHLWWLRFFWVTATQRCMARRPAAGSRIRSVATATLLSRQEIVVPALAPRPARKRRGLIETLDTTGEPLCGPDPPLPPLGVTPVPLMMNVRGTASLSESCTVATREPAADGVKWRSTLHVCWKPNGVPVHVLEPMLKSSGLGPPSEKPSTSRFCAPTLVIVTERVEVVPVAWLPKLVGATVAS